MYILGDNMYILGANSLFHELICPFYVHVHILGDMYILGANVHFMS